MDELTETDIYNQMLSQTSLRGFHEIVKLLVDNGVKVTPDVLCNVMKHFDQTPNEQVDYKKCFDHIEPFLTEDLVNTKDSHGYAAIHYALSYVPLEIIWKLLKLGASLPSRVDLNPEVLKGILDKCVKMDRDSSQITFNYAPILGSKKESGEDSEVVIDIQKALEEAPLNDQLLQELGGTDLVFDISRSRKLRHLLVHPVIAAFIELKWKRVQMVFFISFFVYVAFLSSLMAYLWLYYYHGEHILCSEFTAMMQAILRLTCFLAVLIELLEFYVFRANYFAYTENWIEMGLIAVTIGTQFKGSQDWRTQSTAIAGLLVAFESLFLLNQAPCLGSSATYVAMLKVVSISYLKVSICFACLFISFGLSFHALDRTISIPKSLMNTILMFAGQLDSSSIKYDEYPVTAVVNCLIFAFFVAVILSNLLTAIAINDTEPILKDAQLITLGSQIYNVKGVERIERKCKLQFFKNRSFLRYLDEKLLKLDTNGKVMTCTGHRRLSRDVVENAQTVLLMRKEQQGIEQLAMRIEEMKQHLVEILDLYRTGKFVNETE